MTLIEGAVKYKMSNIVSCHVAKESSGSFDVLFSAFIISATISMKEYIVHEKAVSSHILYNGTSNNDPTLFIVVLFLKLRYLLIPQLRSILKHLSRACSG